MPPPNELSKYDLLKRQDMPDFLRLLGLARTNGLPLDYAAILKDAGFPTAPERAPAERAP